MTLLDPEHMETLFELDREVGPGWLRGLFNSFQRSANGRIDALKTALTEGDTKTAAFEAHALKSSASSIGALQMRKMAEKIEALAKNEDLAGARAEISELFDCYERSSREISSLLC